LLLLVWLVVRFWPATFTVRAAGFLGIPIEVEGLAVEIFPHDDSGGGVYPPAAVGTFTLTAAGASLDPGELPAGGSFLRADSPRHGIVAGYVPPGSTDVDLEFGVPRTLRGTAQDATGAPVAGARVLALPHRYGPVLAEAVSDARGEFAVTRLSSSSSFFAVRVLRPGYAVLEADVQLVETTPVTLRLTPSQPVLGRVELPAGVAPGPLVVRALRCPGVEAPVAADGSFRLESLPTPPTWVRLLVHGLPPELTHAATRATAGDEGVVVAIERAAVARGFVVTADRDLPVPGAYVHHPHGPSGGAGVYADAHGAFQLGALPPGRVRIEALGGPRRAGQKVDSPADSGAVPSGFADVDIGGDQAVEHVVVRVH